MKGGDDRSVIFTVKDHGFCTVCCLTGCYGHESEFKVDAEMSRSQEPTPVQTSKFNLTSSKLTLCSLATFSVVER